MKYILFFASLDIVFSIFTAKKSMIRKIAKKIYTFKYFMSIYTNPLTHQAHTHCNNKKQRSELAYVRCCLACFVVML